VRTFIQKLQVEFPQKITFWLVNSYIFKVPPQIPGRKSVDGVGSDGVGHAKHAREYSPDVSPGFGFNKIEENRSGIGGAFFKIQFQ
jgi:hypothetical protein